MCVGLLLLLLQAFPPPLTFARSAGVDGTICVWHVHVLGLDREAQPRCKLCCCCKPAVVLFRRTMDFGTSGDRGLDCSLRLAGIKALGCVRIAAAKASSAFAFARESARGVLATLTEALAEAQQQSLRDLVAFRLNHFAIILVAFKVLRRASHRALLDAAPERRHDMQADKAGLHLSLVDTRTIENDYRMCGEAKRQKRRRDEQA